MLFSTNTKKIEFQIKLQKPKKDYHTWLKTRDQILEFNIEQGFNLGNINNSFNMKITGHAVSPGILTLPLSTVNKTSLQLSLQSNPLM
jgi:hypothetical protein